MEPTARRTAWRALLALALAAISSLLLASLASATYDPVGSGTTTISLDKGFSKLLKKNGVKVVGMKPGLAKGKRIVIPVSGGKVDPTTAAGTIYHAGGFKLTAHGRAVSFKKLIVKTTQKHAPLAAKVSGGQLKLAKTSSLKTARSGFGFVVTASKLKLSEKVASRLDKRLKLKDVFSGGQLLGTAVTSTQPLTTAVLPAGAVSFAPDAQTFGKLERLFVATNPIAPAEHAGAGFTFPIAGGSIAPDGTSGLVQSSGSLEMIKLKGGQLFLREPLVDLGAHVVTAELEVIPAPPNKGKLGRVPVAALGLPGAGIASNPSSRTVTIAGAPATLSDVLAASMNEVFAEGKPEFKAGEPLGVFSFAAQGQ
jgi:hypothetical protein